jgi:hypothetical protein
MSFTKEVEIASTKLVQAKIVPLQYLFSGTKLDQGQGKVCITSVGRDAEGVEHPLKAACPQGYVECDIASILANTYAGLTGVQILEALAALADSLYSTAEPV